MKTVYLFIAIMCFFVLGACTPKVIIPSGYCVQYAVSWDAEKNIPEQNLCVCTEDVFTGLTDALGALMSFPDTIEMGEVVLPAKCTTPKPATTNTTDEGVKKLLSQ